MYKKKMIRRHREKITIYQPRRKAWNRPSPHSPQKEPTIWDF